MNCFMCRFKALCAVKYDGGYERAKEKKGKRKGERESERASEREEKRERQHEIPGVEQPLMSLLAPS